jgi:hypothetical protein
MAKCHTKFQGRWSVSEVGMGNTQTQIAYFLQGVQLKIWPLTKPWICHIRCCLSWFCWYDILLGVQELARLLQERGEPVLVIRISWISWQWMLVFEQCHFLCFHNAVNSGKIFILESYLKRMSYTHCRQSFFEKFRKVVRNMVKRVDKCTEMNGHHFQHLLYIQVSCVI